jgi:hypothetical protein
MSGVSGLVLEAHAHEATQSEDTDNDTKPRLDGRCLEIRVVGLGPEPEAAAQQSSQRHEGLLRDVSVLDVRDAACPISTG